MDETILTGGGTRSVADALIGVGDVVAGYRIEAIAGAGGMGVVFRAVEPGLERSVALKVILPQYARDPAFRELFIRESTTAAGLEHPNVIPVYRAGADGGHLYIAMRFVEGESLDQLIARCGRLAPGRAARLVAQVAGALDAAHEHGLVHRDVKPANVMIADPDGEEHVYLTDFGLSAPGADDGGSGRWAGTPGYLAPEQITGRVTDRRTDVYALGCVLFRALTGRAPFQAGDEDGVLAAHVTEPPPLVTGVAPEVPAGFDEVVQRALAKRPEARFASAGELARAALATRFDVHLCHAPEDADSAAILADALEDDGLEPWLAARRAAPGRDHRAEALEGLRASDACAVLVGAGGLGEWARGELAAAQETAARERGYRLFAVLLPGAPEPFDPSLAILAARPWVDLRAGLGDEDGRRDLVRAVRGDLRLGPPLAAVGAGECPYRGLEPFDEDQAELFFGREEETAEALERLRGARFLAVLGPSGSGKSSLLRAGVIPGLRGGALPGSERWRIRAFSPGPRPLDALAAQLREQSTPDTVEVTPDELLASEQALDRAAARELAGRPASERLVLVVDQLEEAFTLCRSEDERRAFLANLRYAATIPGGRVVVLLSLRADFYQRCADDPRLRILVAGQQLLLGPLDADGLRRAIEEPARLAGLELEPGLARRILADVADRPGTLPLVEHLLFELWHRRRGRTLTLEAYAASGGVEGALAKRANAVYGGLDPERQRIARRLLLRLTQPGEGTEDTRRRATLDELITEPAERDEVESTIRAMAEARLLTTGRDEASGAPTVEVTHEALIRGWPELRSWINDARERLRLERRLTDAARDWEAGGRDEGLLYRGAPLGAWQDRDLGGLSPLEREFLGAARHRAERERTAGRRRLRVAVAALAVGLAAITAVAVLAIVRGNQAADERDLARSRQIAAGATAELSADPELAVLLAQEAYKVRAATSAEEALRQAAYESRVRAVLPGALRPVFDAAVGPDGRLVVIGDADGRLRLWDWRRGTVQTLGRRGKPVYAVAVSRDGRNVASAGADGTVRIWDIATRRQVAVQGLPTAQRAILGSGYLTDVEFSPDGRRVVASGGDSFVRVATRDGHRAIDAQPSGVVFVWDWRGGGRPANRSAQDPVLAATFSPDGRRIAYTQGGDGVWTWRWTRGPDDAAPARLIGHGNLATEAPQSIAFAGGGGTIVTAGLDGRLTQWDASASKPRLVLPNIRAFTVAMAPDDRHAISAADRGAATVWDTRGEDPPVALRGAPGVVVGAAFAPDGRHVVTASNDGSVQVWDWRAGPVPTVLSRGMAALSSLAFSRDGRRVAAATSGGTVRTLAASGRGALGKSRSVGIVDAAGGVLATAGSVASSGQAAAWGATDGTVFFDPTGRDPAATALHDGPVNAVAVNSSASEVASGGSDGTVQIWNGNPDSLPTVLRGHRGPVQSVVFASDGVHAASGGQDGTVRVWDGRRRVGMTVGRGHRGPVNAVAFSGDGRRVASGGQDGTVRVWDAGTSSDALSVLRGHEGPIEAIAFSPDGRLVASTGQDGTLRAWDWAREVRVLIIRQPPQDLEALSFDPGGGRIVTGGADGVVRLWRCEVCGSVEEALALARARATRALTRSERAALLQQGSG